MCGFVFPALSLLPLLSQYSLSVNEERSDKIYQEKSTRRETTTAWSGFGDATRAGAGPGPRGRDCGCGPMPAAVAAAAAEAQAVASRWVRSRRVGGCLGSGCRDRAGGGGGSRQGSARLVLSLPLSSLIESRHRDFHPGDQWSCLHPGFLAVAAQRQGDRDRFAFPRTASELAPSRGPGVTLRGTRRTPVPWLKEKEPRAPRGLARGKPEGGRRASAPYQVGVREGIKRRGVG